MRDGKFLPPNVPHLDEEELSEIMGKHMWEQFKERLMREAIQHASAESKQGTAEANYTSAEVDLVGTRVDLVGNETGLGGTRVDLVGNETGLGGNQTGLEGTRVDQLSHEVDPVSTTSSSHEPDLASPDIPTHFNHHNFPTKALLELITQSPPLVGEFTATLISDSTYIVILPTTKGYQTHYLRTRPAN